MTTHVPAKFTSRWRARVHRATHGAGPLRRRWVVWSGGGLAVLLAAGLVALAVPLPLLDSFLSRQITERISSQVACPGSLAEPVQVTLGGGRLVPQVLRERLSEVRLSVPDATLNGVPHAAFAATLRDVSQPAADRTHVGSMDATITVRFAHLPSPAGTPAPTYQRTEDGRLAVKVQMPAGADDNVKATLFLKMQLRDETVASVPQRLKIFGRTLPAGQVGDLAGGTRTEKLPHLPDGVSYKSIAPQRDGVHVALSGVSTTALSALPTDVGGQTVSYSAQGGLLGISTSVGIEPIIDVPLTIFTAPRLDGAKLTLVPQKVHILGADHSTTDLLGKLVLTQIKQEDLTRTLPALPSGVRYQSVAVDGGGIHVTVGGVTVEPFSELKQPDSAHRTTFGAEDGLLTATAKGGSDNATPVVLLARPTIKGSTLNIAAEQIEMFGTRFPAASVLAEVKTQQTAYPLQSLPANLAYQGVQVLPDGLRISLSGKDVTLARGALAGGTC